MFLESRIPGIPKQKELAERQGRILEYGNQGIQKQNELAERRSPCSWSPKIQAFKKQKELAERQGRYPGVWKSRNPKTKATG